jgi:very-short-patch-repair endonuclease
MITKPFIPIRPNETKSRVFAKTMRRAMTHAEVLLWQALRHDTIDGMRFRRQHPIGHYIADFACAPVKLVVEVDGATHGSDAEVEHDQRRSEYLAERGWHIMRFANARVYSDLAGVVEHIWFEVRRLKVTPSTAATRRSPSPASGGG